MGCKHRKSGNITAKWAKGAANCIQMNLGARRQWEAEGQTGVDFFPRPPSYGSLCTLVLT